jgi:hypothetical protein
VIHPEPALARLERVHNSTLFVFALLATVLLDARDRRDGL